MARLALTFFCAFTVGIVIAPLVIFCINKLKARQTILSYVTQHKNKEGIPTMGGFIFLIPLLITSLIFFKGEHKLAIVALCVTFSYGLIGCIDDSLKIIFKRNMGLRAYQKIISQLVIAVIATYFAYNNNQVGSEIKIPIFEVYVNLKWWYYPLSIFIYIATTNSVNLTDGLDGLAGSTVSIYMVALYVIVINLILTALNDGRTFYGEELYNILIFLSALIGGLLAFLWKNTYKAKIFMGDTGSLALGGACTIIPMLIKNPILIAVIGIMFMVSSISVILQVLSCKLVHKRIFLMSPYHHHLEMKGYNESKIVAFYCIITVICGVLAILIA